MICLTFQPGYTYLKNNYYLFVSTQIIRNSIYSITYHEKKFDRIMKKAISSFKSLSSEYCIQLLLAIFRKWLLHLACGRLTFTKTRSPFVLDHVR